MPFVGGFSSAFPFHYVCGTEVLLLCPQLLPPAEQLMGTQPCSHLSASPAGTTLCSRHQSLQNNHHLLLVPDILNPDCQLDGV